MADFFFLNTVFGETIRYSLAGASQGTVFTGGANTGVSGTIHYAPNSNRFYAIRNPTGTHSTPETEFGYYLPTGAVFVPLFHLVPTADSPDPGFSENTRYFGHVTPDERFILWTQEITGTFTADPGSIVTPFAPWNFVWIHDNTGALVSQRGPLSAYPYEVAGGNRSSDSLIFIDLWQAGNSDVAQPGGDPVGAQYVHTISPTGAGFHADSSVLVAATAFSDNGADILFSTDEIWSPFVDTSDSSWHFRKANAGGVFTYDLASGLPDPELNASLTPMVQVRSTCLNQAEDTMYLLLLNFNTGVSSIWSAPVASLAFTHVCNVSTAFGGWSAKFIIAPWDASLGADEIYNVTLIGAT